MEPADWVVTFAYRMTVEAESQFEAVQNATIHLGNLTPQEVYDGLVAIDVEIAPGDEEDE